MLKPTNEEINLLTKNILQAWLLDNPPNKNNVVVDAREPEIEIIEKYYGGKKWTEINLDAREICQASTLTWMTPTAYLYYIPAHMVFFLRTSGYGEIYTSFQTIVLMGSFCYETIREAIEIMTDKQLECLLEFMRMVRKYKKSYGYEELINTVERKEKFRQVEERIQEILRRSQLNHPL